MRWMSRMLYAARVQGERMFSLPILFGLLPCHPPRLVVRHDHRHSRDALQPQQGHQKRDPELLPSKLLSAHASGVVAESCFRQYAATCL